MGTTTITVVDYQPAYRQVFKDLNVQWITEYFEMEESDHKALDNPESYILANGGKILVALENDQPVGVCALIKVDDPEYGFELAKMAVSPEARGKGIGLVLGKAVIETARSLGARKIFLESNSKLQPALRLYEKLGFRHIYNRPTPYKRADVQMELDLEALPGL